MAFYTNFATDFFHTVFARRSVLKGTLRRDQKVIFVKSPISSPIVMQWEELAWVRHSRTGEEPNKFKCLEAKCREKPWKKPWKVRARTYGNKSPSRSEALRFIDSAKSPSTCRARTFQGFSRHLASRHLDLSSSSHVLLLPWTKKRTCDRYLSWSRSMQARPNKCSATAMRQSNSVGSSGITGYDRFDPHLSIAGASIRYLDDGRLSISWPPPEHCCFWNHLSVSTPGKTWCTPFSTRQNSTSCNFASVAIPSFRCPKAFLGFSNSRSHSHLREKAPGQITRFLEEMGWPAQMCKHRHSFCWWPPSPRFKSAQISALTGSSSKVLSLSFFETPRTPVVGSCMPPFLPAKEVGGNDLHPQLKLRAPLQSFKLIWPLLAGPLHLRGKAWAYQNQPIISSAHPVLPCASVCLLISVSLMLRNNWVDSKRFSCRVAGLSGLV